MTDYKPLDPILHSQIRLAIMSTLVGVEFAEFSFLKRAAGTSDSNLSVQLAKLEEAGYITISKTFRGKKPLTTCSITKEGVSAFRDYIENLSGYIKS